jgi:probable F420-dependent oxidoreductase
VNNDTEGTAIGRLDLGPIGVSLNITADGAHLDQARQLEQLGYRTVWLPGGQLDTLDHIAQIIGATATIQVASAIISPDVHPPGEVAQLYAALQASTPDRFVVGLGGSQRPPSLQGLHRYLDQLDHAVPPVSADRRLLAALGPRKLQLARGRCAGAIALLVTPAYTRQARTILGPDSMLVIDQFVVLDTDPVRARQTARGRLRFLASVAGYRANFARMGFSGTDIATLSDDLVDALVAWGDADTIAHRVTTHHDAGADHVILAVLSEAGQPGALDVAQLLGPPHDISNPS